MPYRSAAPIWCALALLKMTLSLWYPIAASGTGTAALPFLPLASMPQPCLRLEHMEKQIGMYGAVQLPCFYQVRFSADPDEPVTVVPSCCVWTGNGLNMIPAKVGTDSATLDLQRVAGEPLMGSSTVFCLSFCTTLDVLCVRQAHAGSCGIEMTAVLVLSILFQAMLCAKCTYKMLQAQAGTVGDVVKSSLALWPDSSCSSPSDES